jgi:hypothetical protein
MRFHWGAKRAARHLGKVLLGFICLAAVSDRRKLFGNRRSLAIDDALRSCLFPQSPWN